MNEVYDNVMSSALIRTEGRFKEADYFVNCSYFEYYWRCQHAGKYQEAMKAHYDQANKKTA